MRKCRFIFGWLMLGLLFSILTHPAYSLNQKHDSTWPGPHKTTFGEYRFPATVDNEILSDRMTEIWAKIFYPADIASMSNPLPLVVMLHGNHGTCGFGSQPRIDNSCQYTDSGTCPAGYVVTPNHEGYNYLAENLASWGYIVVSINANRGITCGSGQSGDWGLNLARGKLVLKHLSLLSEWARIGNAPDSIGLGAQGLIGKINFSAVGLFGHSRGGEGVRAAYNLYRDPGSPWPVKIPGLSIKAIFEIGAVDGQTARVLDANDTVWNQLLPMCDGDVSDLQGRYPFERMLLNLKEPKDAQKSLYEVWGANHNYFNTEWQESDADRCGIGKEIFDPNYFISKEQQQVALASVPAFFRSHLGSAAESIFNQNFNPLNSLPQVVTAITPIDRDFTPSPAVTEMMVMDDFDEKTGINSSGQPNLANHITINHQFLLKKHPQRAASVSWKKASQETFFEAIFAGPSQGRDIHDFTTLDFRVARQKNLGTSSLPTQFNIQLEDATGQLSKQIPVSDYTSIDGPGTEVDTVLKTVRIPLSVFQGIDLKKVRGVRFVFNQSPTGTIYLANIRAQKQWGLGKNENVTLPLRHPLLSQAKRIFKPVPLVHVPEKLNTIRVVHHPVKRASATQEPLVEIVVASQVPFPARNNLPVLNIGNQRFYLSRYSDPTHLKELTFTLTREQYQRLPQKNEVTVTDGKIWKFAALEK